MICGQVTCAGGVSDIHVSNNHLYSPGIKMFYPEDPLWIVRGEGQYLFDQNGIKYLDCVNNISHSMCVSVVAVVKFMYYMYILVSYVPMSWNMTPLISVTGCCDYMG